MKRWILITALLFIVAASVVTPAQSVQAASRCGGSIVMPIVWQGKPAISVYTGSNVRPENVKITFNGWQVPAPSDWGIRTNAPQSSTGGKWVYFIATRWLSSVPTRWGIWADGWRWQFIYDC